MARRDTFDPTASKVEILRRLRCSEGHTRGISRMVTHGADPIEIVRQVRAIQASLTQVGSRALAKSLQSMATEDPNVVSPVMQVEFLKQLGAIIGSGSWHAMVALEAPQGESPGRAEPSDG